jgi:hypothetical protein
MDKPGTSGQALFWQLAAPVRGPLVLSGVLLAVSALSGLLLRTSPTYARFWAERTESLGWTIDAR